MEGQEEIFGESLIGVIFDGIIEERLGYGERASSVEEPTVNPKGTHVLVDGNVLVVQTNLQVVALTHFEVDKQLVVSLIDDVFRFASEMGIEQGLERIAERSFSLTDGTMLVICLAPLDDHVWITSTVWIEARRCS